MSPRARKPSPKLGPRFETALAEALYVHKDQTRKGKPTPYVSHLLGVCSIVLQYGGSEDEAIGALLHDTLEDQPELVTPAGLRKRYGAKVLAIVQGCTDTPKDYKGGAKPAWRVRKDAYVKHMVVAGKSTQLVALADKLHNLRDINSDLREHGKKTLSRFNAGAADLLWYYAQVLRALTKSGFRGALLDAYALEVKEFRRLTK
jgi:GTP pyrophosphokinase